MGRLPREREEEGSKGAAEREEGPSLDAVDMDDYEHVVDYDELTRLLGEPIDMGLDSLRQGRGDTQVAFAAPVADPLMSLSWILDGMGGDIDEKEDSLAARSLDRSVDDMFAFSPRFDLLPPSPSADVPSRSSAKDFDLDELRAFVNLPGDMERGQLVEAALASNRKMQEEMKSVIDILDEQLRANSRSLQQLKKIQDEARLHEQEETVEPGTARSDPYAAILNDPDAGLDEEQRKRYIELQERWRLRSMKPVKWTRKERRELARGVRQENQKLLLEQAMERNHRAITDLHTELERIKGIPEKELELNTQGIDFSWIAREFCPRRSPLECKLQWCNVDRPGLSLNKKWTPLELSQLKDLGGKLIGQDPDMDMGWDGVAARIGTNRPGFECAAEFQRRYHPHGSRGKWSEQEDAALRTAVQKYGDDNWARVATAIPGRSSYQCIHRWRKALAPHIKRGKWTPAEDKALIRAVQMHGVGAWQKTAGDVPGRTDVQCRERWTNVLDPEIKRGKFTAAEDDLLQRAVAEEGEGKWAAVAAAIPGRTDNQCWRRWKRLKLIKARQGQADVLDEDQDRDQDQDEIESGMEQGRARTKQKRRIK